jgi:hypothetical protein
LDRRIFLDANALLNASYIPTSFSRRAVLLAARAGDTFFCGEQTLLEARRIAAELGDRLNVRFNPQLAIDHFVHTLRLEIAGPVGLLNVPGEIPRNDRHVFAEAAQINAEILTSDVDLWLACRTVGRPVLTPLQMIRLYDELALSNSIFGVSPSPESGHIFLRSRPGSWADARHNGKYTGVDLSGCVWLYYDTGEGAWAAHFDGWAEPLRIPKGVARGALETVSISWERDAGVVFRVAGVDHPVITPMTNAIGPVMGWRIASNRAAQDYWNGHIWHCVADDRQLGGASWRKVLRDKELCPNPYDSHRLEQTFRGMDQRYF